MSSSCPKVKRSLKKSSVRGKVTVSDNEAEGVILETFCCDGGSESLAVDESTVPVQSCRYGLRSVTRRKSSRHAVEILKSSLVRKRARESTDDVTGSHEEAGETGTSLEGEFSALEKSKEPISVSRSTNVPDSKAIEMDDEDEAPQDVSLAAARQQAVEKLHQLEVNQHRVLLEAKERKRRKHKLFRKQKEQKQYLSFDRFDEEELKEIAIALRDSEDESRNQPSVEKSDPPSKKTHVPSSKRSIGPVEVMLLEKEPSKATAASLEKAQAFLQGSLYGERHNRAPALTVNAMRYTTTPAANFN